MSRLTTPKLSQIFKTTCPSVGKALEYTPTEGNIAGCDFSGTVEQIGAEVTAGLFKVGDRVAGWVHGGESASVYDCQFTS